MNTIRPTYRKNHLLLDTTANAAVIAAAVLVLGSVMFNGFNDTPGSTDQMASRMPPSALVVAHATTNAAHATTTTPATVVVAYRASNSPVAAQ